jgi:hypothetical protein
VDWQEEVAYCHDEGSKVVASRLAFPLVMSRDDEPTLVEEYEA